MDATTGAGSADNEIFLRGRLAADPMSRVLPSGDELCSFRLTVRRAGASRVDSIECAATLARVQRTLAKAEVGDELEVRGCLRRRFWRSPAGPASRYEVDVSSARVSVRGQVSVRRRSGAAPGRKQASG